MSLRPTSIAAVSSFASQFIALACEKVMFANLLAQSRHVSTAANAVNAKAIGTALNNKQAIHSEVAAAA
jgi:hypothetical protein